LAEVLFRAFAFRDDPDEVFILASFQPPTPAPVATK